MATAIGRRNNLKWARLCALYAMCSYIPVGGCATASSTSQLHHRDENRDGIESVVPPPSVGHPGAESVVQDGHEPPKSATDTTRILSTLRFVHQKAGGSTNIRDLGFDCNIDDELNLETVTTAVDGAVTLAGLGGDWLLAAIHSLRLHAPGGVGSWGSGDEGPGRYAHATTWDVELYTGSRYGVLDEDHDFDADLNGEEAQDDQRRASVREYKPMFNGTGTDQGDRDAAVEGTAYLGYRVLSDRKYDVEGCWDACDQVNGCVFVNLYYEFNNHLSQLDGTPTTLKCALYGDVHTADEKTNWGHQQLLPAPEEVTYIQHSSGWAWTDEFQQPIPDGYEYIFGPIDYAVEATGYMGFVLLDKYDVQACANVCSGRNSDPFNGACKFFNIWRALDNGVPVSYVCVLYSVPTDEVTATFSGNDTISVSSSRGFRRISYILDGGFENYNPTCRTFCYSMSYSNWIGSNATNGGHEDASIFYYIGYAHTGHGVALLGDAGGQDSLPGTLTYAYPLITQPGSRYKIGLFHDSTYSGKNLEKDAFVEVWWNREVVGTIQEGYSPWKYWEFEVVASGHDELAFHGGKAPAWSFIDDVNVFLA